MRSFESHAGMILVHQQTLSIGERMRRLIKMSDARSIEDMHNRLEFLSHW
jgi:hypothetical protein